MESATIEVRCSKSGRVMRVGFARLSPNRPFHVEAVLPGSGVSTSVGCKRLLAAGDGAAAPTTVYIDNTARQRDASEFDWSAFGCIHCDEPSLVAPIIECGTCHTLICGGTLRPKRRDQFQYSCGVCGVKSSGRFGSSIESFAARPRQASAPALSSGGGGILGAARHLLPGGRKDQ